MIRATPKSVSFASCAGVTGRSGIRMFDGLTSRWTTRSPWAWASAPHSAMPISTMSRSDRRPASSSWPERRAADQLGDQVRPFVVDGRLVQRDDPGVGQAGGRAGLALEPPADDPLAGQQLDGDVALQSLVAGVPNRPEPARAEAAVQAIAVEDDRAAVLGGGPAAGGAERGGPRSARACARGRRLGAVVQRAAVVHRARDRVPLPCLRGVERGRLSVSARAKRATALCPYGGFSTLQWASLLSCSPLYAVILRCPESCGGSEEPVVLRRS